MNRACERPARVRSVPRVQEPARPAALDACWRTPIPTGSQPRRRRGHEALGRRAKASLLGRAKESRPSWRTDSASPRHTRRGANLGQPCEEASSDEPVGMRSTSSDRRPAEMRVAHRTRRARVPRDAPARESPPRTRSNDRATDAAARLTRPLPTRSPLAYAAGPARGPLGVARSNRRARRRSPSSTTRATDVRRITPPLESSSPCGARRPEFAPGESRSVHRAMARRCCEVA